MKFTLITVVAMLAVVAKAAPAPAGTALYFADKDETCSLSANNDVECVPGRTPGALDASDYKDVIYEEDEDTKRALDQRTLERRWWPTCWWGDGNANCRAKCRGLGKCNGHCYGFIGPTCVCSASKC
ncbi:unnamed protein product [Cutaneotrichosporon oleaginosum]